MTSLRAKRMGSARPDEGGLLSGGVSVRRHTMRRPATLYLRLVVGGLAALSIYFLNGTFAQEPTQPSGAIEAAQDAAADGAMAERIRAIFAEIDGLGAVGVDVSGGVVTLSGEAANERLAEQALAIASRIQGAVTVVDEIKRTMAVEENLSPVVDDFTTALDTAARAWPLYLVALLGFAAVAGLGRLLASFGALWTWLTPNALIARMVSQLVSLASLIGGVLLALSILDAMALFGAVAGGAGLVGLAIGFAVRDTIENYIASIMLSLRQPFRAEDHVVINDQEGVIVRLTSRATILMTLDGNHLRIPNADVFKGVILNYSRNPERRFDFTLGVSADDDPIAAMKSALDAIHDLDFLLRDPEPIAFIKEVGDSNIMLAFMAWIDQRTTGFLKARSAAISVAKTALERDGFTLPEPIYRVRLDGENPSRPTVVEAKPPPPDSTLTTRQVSGPEAFDVEPDETAKEQAALERQTSGGEDLLDPEQPIE